MVKAEQVLTNFLKLLGSYLSPLLHSWTSRLDHPTLMFFHCLFFDWLWGWFSNITGLCSNWQHDLGHIASLQTLKYPGFKFSKDYSKKLTFNTKKAISSLQVWFFLTYIFLTNLKYNKMKYNMQVRLEENYHLLPTLFLIRSNLGRPSSVSA